MSRGRWSIAVPAAVLAALLAAKALQPVPPEAACTTDADCAAWCDAAGENCTGEPSAP